MNNIKTDERDDRRVRRTRLAIFEAFSNLVLSQRYDEIRAADIIEGADIGRSTFYAHFKNKDDVLLSSIEPLFEMLASAITEEGHTERLEFVLSHFWDKRALARIIFSNDLFFGLSRKLAQMTEVKMSPEISYKLRHLFAIDIASSQLFVIKSWLAGEVSFEVGMLAEYIEKQSRARIISLLDSEK